MTPPPASVTRRTQAERRDASEQALVRAAARVIEEEGFAAVTFERVGAIAGYSRGLAAHRFGSKDGLVHAVIQFSTERVLDRVEAALAHIPSPVARILGWTDTLLDAVENDQIFRAYFVMMAAAVGNRAPIRSAFLDAHDDVRCRLREMIEEAHLRGEVATSINADATALAIGSLQLGISVEFLLDPDMDIAPLRATARRAISGMLGLIASDA